MSRRRVVGAEPLRDGVSFRVWAPAHEHLSVVIGDRDHPLEAEGNGYFSAVIAEARPGTRYRIRAGDDAYPDPASRFQPEGPHGPSEVVDPGAYVWRDSDWRFVNERLVISEIHIGTFTPAGTWRAAIEKLPLLREVGINLVEVMPVNEFPGRFGWGYDGVDLWAPAHIYGRPDDFRAFVDAAHATGVGVILDVVYNHFGPDGNYLGKFTPRYFASEFDTEWGEAVNFDGQDSHGVRDFVAENAAHWIDEYHLDGLRLDATQSLHDSSPEHVVKTIADRARAAAGGRTLFLVAENEPQDVKMLTTDGLDALWNDDWHHSAFVAATGRSEAYYSDYRGAPQELVSAAKYGFLFQGQRYAWQKNRRGTPSIGIDPARFVCYLENHDQVANSARGERLHQLTSRSRWRALTALLLLGPATPMLFQGQEFASSKPFLYFVDHKPELAEAVAKGRAEFFLQFPSIETATLALPHDPATFEACKLDWSERDSHAESVRMHRDLLRLRQAAERFDGAVVAAEALCLRFFGDDDRLLFVNLGRNADLTSIAEPLVAPPAGRRWRLLWSSEAPEYGGGGTAAIESHDGWHIPGHAAVLLIAEPIASR